MTEIKFKIWNKVKKVWLRENVFLSHDGVIWYRKPGQRMLVKLNPEIYKIILLSDDK